MFLKCYFILYNEEKRDTMKKINKLIIDAKEKQELITNNICNQSIKREKLNNSKPTETSYDLE